MKRALFAGTPVLCAAVIAALSSAFPPKASADATTDAVADFLAVARVLQSPRCMNCHPRGDAPLQTDRSVPHAMYISRASNDAGLACATCHRSSNSPAVGGPPGAPGWRLPPRATPMVFEGKTPAEICAQVKDPARNGKKSLPDLLEHMEHDPFVHWGFSPGPGRTLPPMSHAALVEHTRRWIAAGAPCP